MLKKKYIVGLLCLAWVTAILLPAPVEAASSITVGSLTSDAVIWRHIAKSPQAKKAGLKIKVREVSDPVGLNTATARGEIDVNAFQSVSYLKAYNHENKGKAQLAMLGTTYLEPMGIYSKKLKSLKQLKDGATVALANNPANTSRGLALLQTAGLIKLKANFNANSNETAISQNPHHLKFKEIDDNTGPRVLGDVDIALISNSVALAGHLNILKDSLFHEKVNQSTKQDINVIATSTKNKHQAEYKKLVKLYHDPTIQKWIDHKFAGTKVEVQKPLSYLTK
ncbi:MetQ/NlpA family ABC transporter substrate-binding protein [Loigolactobacillus coryniformis]|uniref:MetQ/NlpA family ABC transporter substrate-binding protein n=1 Tax=Loigolactobacillus coryniformis TaxID=1610 RepID=UPI002340309C|nr:MetQ/NlpA family ABC transporter substrate-binding protein [Loigolactobacillus coryniformis]MDC4186544.1 MetQ/NlpA family ABC transporter substrate-binding protein [Loigolactobacillus coryniformis]